MADIPVHDTKTMAAVDVGTNTVRLLVVRGSKVSSAAIVEEAQQITRLGEGMERQLHDVPMQRTVAAIAGFVRRAQEFQPDRIAILATSAARRAENGSEFCRLVYKATGVMPQIISGRYEAELTVRGVLGAVPAGIENAVILDIGGGSTELVQVADSKVMKIKSLEIGAVTLTERFFHHTGPIPQTELARLGDFAKGVLEGLELTCPAIWVGTAGTITTLASLDQQMVQYDPKKINGYWLTAPKISRWLEVLATMTHDERKTLPGLEPGRADIIVAGAGLLEVIMKHFGQDRITVSDAGFREGIIYSLYDMQSQVT